MTTTNHSLPVTTSFLFRVAPDYMPTEKSERGGGGQARLILPDSSRVESFINRIYFSTESVALLEWC